MVRLRGEEREPDNGGDDRADPEDTLATEPSSKVSRTGCLTSASSSTSMRSLGGAKDLPTRLLLPRSCSGSRSG